MHDKSKDVIPIAHDEVFGFRNFLYLLIKHVNLVVFVMMIVTDGGSCDDYSDRW